jgi:hypothetical protein
MTQVTVSGLSHMDLSFIFRSLYSCNQTDAASRPKGMISNLQQQQGETNIDQQTQSVPEGAIFANRNAINLSG